MAGGAFRQLGLLLWKNLKLQRRRLVAASLEILLPVFFMLIMVGVRKATLNSAVEKCVGGCVFEPIEVSEAWNGQCDSFLLAYNPPEAQPIIDDMQSYLSNRTFMVNITGFGNETSMVDFLLNDVETKQQGCMVGVTFTNLTTNNVQYQLRFDSTPGGFDAYNSYEQRDWLTQFAYPIFQTLGPRDDDLYGLDVGGLPGYIVHDFMGVQQALDRSIANVSIADDTVRQQVVDLLDSVVLQRMPYPKYLDDGFLYAIQFGLPLLIMLSMLFSALSIVRHIVHEKERRLKESMKMMGLANWAHWAAWFLQYFGFALISTTIITIVLKGGGVLQNSDGFVIFIYFLCFFVASISFCFFISSLFSKASSGAAAGGILWFCSYIPYFFIGPRYSTMSYGSKQMACLVSTTAMAIGAQLISEYEGRGDGVQFSTLAQPVSTDDPFTFLTIIGMLLFDAALYGVLTWYIEGVYPGEFGLPKPWYFPFMASYWCGTKPLGGDGSSEHTPLLNSTRVSALPDTFEQDPEDIPCDIEISGLRKEFGDRIAVAGTNLKLYRGQITALLGHNGAGKTTTMNMLTGLYPPTSGTAYVAGHDIRKDMDRVRENLGMCPQHDVLFDTLTVEEHLRFFCMLKGVAKTDIQKHVDDMLEALKLEDKRHAASKTLSGGMKRKLSCGIAFIGGSRVVILDEVTSGMDPSARRATWDLITHFKKDRTILLSTHFLDEADLLGDRIAIMSQGTVQCCGSALFLKGKYGTGYNLAVTKLPECDVPRLKGLVEKHVPSGELKRNIGAEVTFVLGRKDTSTFPPLLRELSSKQEELGIQGYGISVTTLEEVFLRVNEIAALQEEAFQMTDKTAKSAYLHEALADKQSDDSEHSPAAGATNGHDGMVSIDMNQHASSAYGQDRQLLQLRSESLNTGATLRTQQFKAMIVKRMLHSMRNKKAVLTQLVLPMAFTLVAQIIAITFPGPTDSPARDLTNLAKSYGQTNVLFTDQAGSPDSGSFMPANAVSQLLGSSLVDSYDYMPKVTFDNISNSEISWNNMTDYILTMIGDSPRSLAKFNRKHVFAMEFVPETGGSVLPRAMFNGQPYHSVPEAFGIIRQAILSAFSPLNISFENFPLPRNQLERAQDAHDNMMGFYIAFDVLFGMAFLASSFVLFLVTERSNKAKHIQFVSGVGVVSYWTSSYIWDMITFLVPTIGCIIIFAAFGVEAYADERLGYVFLLFVLFGFAIVPVMYLSSFLFSNASLAYTYMTLFNIVTGLAAMLTVSILQVVGGTENVADALRKVFLILPNYCFGQALSDMSTNYDALKVVKESETICKAIGADSIAECCKLAKNSDMFDLSCNPDYLSFSSPGIGLYLVCLVVHSIVFFGLVLLIEAKFFQAIYNSIFKPPTPEHNPLHEDEDVAAERARIVEEIQNAPVRDGRRKMKDVLAVDHLTKLFRGSSCSSRGSKLAVDRLAFGVPHGECFGLLGVNGAGKTTTFRMLTGDEAITSGTAYLDGFDIRTDPEQVRQRIGYCPQFDGLIELMTGRELLRMYAKLRGVPEERVEETVDELLMALHLEPYADKYCGTYSGGNKRKLSTAVALCGNVPIVYLDEPTTGMDPGARRFLWNALLQALEGGRSIILTSHSMEECEALCTRLGIMVNGRFQCFGSLQHLKNRFGQGLTLVAKMAVNERPAFDDWIKNRFPESRLKDQHQGMVHYELHGAYPWADVFEEMEQAKKRHNLIDYSVNQTALEQVFLDFAKHQEEDPLQQ